MSQLSSITPLEIILIGSAAVGVFFFFRACWRNIKRSRQRLSVALLTLMMTLTAQTALADDPSWLRSGDSWDETTKTLTANSATVVANAYNYRTEIEHVVFSNNVQRIDKYAFDDCSNLESVHIGSGVTTIDNEAFTFCEKLATITVDANNQTYDSRGNCNAIISKSNNTLVVGCKNTVIPASVTRIGNYAFKGRDLESITIPDNVTNIGYSAFNTCSNLQSVHIGSGVKIIEEYAFSNCKLTSITLPEGLTTIDKNAFSKNVATIERVDIPQSVTQIEANAFKETSVNNFYINNAPSKIWIGNNALGEPSSTTIHVFTLMANIFGQATNWSTYAGRFVADIDITHVKSFTLDIENMIMRPGTLGKLNATINPADARVKDVVFTSSNDNIVHITNAATGAFEAGSIEGTAIITCTAMDGSEKYATCDVEVSNSFTPATSVTLNETAKGMFPGETFQLTATVNPGDATHKNVTWHSSDESIATVDANGLVTAVDQGVATITVTSHDGNARAYCLIYTPVTTSYVDADGTLHEDVFVPSLTNNVTILTPGWYVVNNTVNYTSNITLNGAGEYHIILADGAQMNIGTSANPISGNSVRGIDESEATRATLTIYGQANGTGELNVYTSGGNGDAIYASNLTINGGKITASAIGWDASGLRASNNITINGGVINARGWFGENDMNYGILATSVIINGGQVTAQGSNKGINSTDTFGGISLSWKNTTDFIDANSYLINDGSSLTIATGKAFTDGNKIYTETNASAVLSLTATKLSPVQAYSVAFDSNGGTDVPTQYIIIGNAATKPTAPTKTGKVFCGWYLDSDCKTPYDFASAVTGQLTLYAKWADTSSQDLLVQRIYRYTGSVVTPVVRSNDGELLTEGTDYTVSYTGATEMQSPGVYTLTVTGKGDYTGSQEVDVRVLTFDKYDGANLVSSTLPENSNAVVVSSSTTAMQSGCWYVVSEAATVADRICVNGDVNLVLCDGATLTAQNGISVTDGHSLTIYSQSGNTGALVANVPVEINNENVYHAAIGGDKDDVYSTPVKAGTITIHGGDINVTTASTAAGIGAASYGYAGAINIYGGKITTSLGGWGGTGIGGDGAVVHLSWCRESDDFILAKGFSGQVFFDKAFAILGTNFGATADNAAAQKIVPTTKTLHTVTYQTNSGNAVESQCMQNGCPAPEPDIPFKAGYEFAGWYTNKEFSGSTYDFATAVNHSFTLYAKWNEVAPISYIGADGQTVTGFKDYTPMENSYTELAEGTYFVGKNITIGSRIELIGTVNLILGDGATLTAEKGIHVTQGNTLNIFGQSAGAGTGTLAASSDNYYAAIGASGGVGCGAINIYGGTVNATGNDIAIGSESNYGSTISILGGKVTATGARGIGDSNALIRLSWRDAANDFIQSTNYQGTVTLDKWFVLKSNDAIEADIDNIAGEKIVPNTTPFYDVSFNTNGGNLIESQRIKEGRSVVQPDAVKQNHTFDGWYDNAGCSGTAYDFTAEVSSSFTLYAKWKAYYGISYNKNGSDATGTMESQTLYVGDSQQLPVCAFSRKGYTFLGWATTGDGDVQYADGANVTDLTTTAGENVTLYAKWQAIPYTISAAANFDVTVGGGAATTATIGQTVTIQAASGYSLLNAPIVIDADGMNRAVSAAGNGSYTFTMPASNVNVEALVVESDWKFIGTYITQNFSATDDDIYGFVGTAGTGNELGSFVQVGGYVRVKPMRAYMQAPAPPNKARAYGGSSSDPTPATLRIRLLGSNGETTGIVDMDHGTWNVEYSVDAWYSLDGRKLQGKPSQKGLYIHNGKVVVIK